jgi:hypothetical protein
LKIRRLCAREELDFLLCVGDAVYLIICALMIELALSTIHSAKRKATHMHPQHWTFNISNTSMQPIAISEVDRRHPGAPSSVVTSIVGLDGLVPKLAHLNVAAFAKANVDEEVTVAICWLKVRG